MANPSEDSESENPGALAGTTGAVFSRGLQETQKYAKTTRNAISLHAEPRHKRAAKMLGFALIGDTPDLWHATGAVWAVRLTTRELISIAYIALRQLDPDARELTFHAAHWGEAA